MTENVLELHAFLEDDGKRDQLYVRILAPTRTQGQQEYFCLVHAPLLLGQDKKIYGIDSDQARLLAVGFVKSLLENRKVIDAAGMPAILK